MSTTEEPGYRGPQVCNIVGITYRQLDYWARTGLLRPSLADAKGSGTQRRYSYRDVLELKVIKQLLDAGVNLQQARRAIACLREGGDDLATANLVLGAEGTVLTRSGEEIVDLLRGQGVFNIVPLAGVLGEVDAAILEITAAVVEREAPVEPERVSSARRGRQLTVPETQLDGSAAHPAAWFAHESELRLAEFFDFYGVAWEYEPVTFTLDWAADGRPISGFRPDFYLPEHDLYIELTTLRQELVTRKNRKVRRLRELYPEVTVKVLYRRDYANLVVKARLAGAIDPNDLVATEEPLGSTQRSA